MDALRAKLDRKSAALLIIDIQERMVAAMDPSRMARLMNRTRALVEGAKAMDLPILLTEQYPKGLGPTLPELRKELPASVEPVEKLEFTAAVPEILKRLGDRPQVLLCGMETHVCVFQTARDLLLQGKVPYLCADALLSRTEEDRALGLERCRALGAVVTTVEGALFDLLGRAGTPEFKRVSAAVR